MITSSPNQAPLDLDRPEWYINRELSAVAFFRRVLDEAKAGRHPPLESVKFLGIVNALLDEFWMVRVAGLKDQQVAQVVETGPDGMLPGEQIAALRPQLRDLLRDQTRCWRDALQPLVAHHGIAILDHAALSRAQRAAAATYFREEVFPVLTPLGVDPGHPFPHISNRSLNLAVVLRDPVAGELFARVKVPSTLRRLVPLPVNARDRARPGAPSGVDAQSGAQARYAFVWLEQVIARHLDQLFPGIEIVAAYPFRVLRDADFEIQRDEASDLLATVKHGLRERRFGSVVAVHVQADMPESVRSLLCENLEIEESDIFEADGPLGLDDLSELLDLDRPDLKDPPLVQRVPPELRMGRDPFMAIQRGDLLLHHPYDTFSSVAEFIEAAARDPQVLAIKQTLYRVGANSRIVHALLEANER